MRALRIVIAGPFGLRARGTMPARALPLARALERRGHAVRLVLPPWDSPADAGRSWTDAGVEVVNLPLAGVALPAAWALPGPLHPVQLTRFPE